jgi:putative methyltransferase (TIGR04325 family)
MSRASSLPGSFPGCDVLIASGSLHYFEQPQAEMLATLEVRPRHLLINRTPCTREDAGATEDLITVQDNDSYMVPSKVHNVRKLVRSLEAAGHTLRASWPVYERHLWIRCIPISRRRTTRASTSCGAIPNRAGRSERPG